MKKRKNGQVAKKPLGYRTDVYETYAYLANNWIALTPDESELLAHSPDLLVAAKIAEGKGCEHPHFVHIPPANTNFAF